MLDPLSDRINMLGPLNDPINVCWLQEWSHKCKLGPLSDRINVCWTHWVTVLMYVEHLPFQMLWPAGWTDCLSSHRQAIWSFHLLNLYDANPSSDSLETWQWQTDPSFHLGPLRNYNEIERMCLSCVESLIMYRDMDRFFRREERHKCCCFK